MRVFFVEHKKAFKTKPYKLGKIFKKVRSFNFNYTLRVLSALNTAVSSREQNINIQSKILRMLFNKNEYNLIVESLNNLVRKNREPFIVFHRQQILLLIKTILLKGDLNNHSDYKETKSKLGLMLSSMNAYIAKDNSRNGETKEEEIERLSKFFVPSNFFSTTTNYHGTATVQKIARTLIIWKDLYQRLRLSGTITHDYETDFKNIVGVSFEEYLNILFSVFIHFMTIDPETADFDRYFFNIPTYFSTTNVSLSDAENVINTCKIDIPNFANNYASIVQNALKNQDNYLFNFTQFQDKPLMELENGQIYPIDLGYFAMKVQEGIYWELNSYYKENPAEKKKYDFMPKMMGYIYEEYVKDVLSTLFKSDLHILIPSGVAGVPQAEGLFIINLPNGKKFLVIFEVKHIRLKLQTLLKRDLQASIEDFKKILSKSDGLGQIYSTLEQLYDGRLVIPGLNTNDIEEILPLVVASHFIPDDPFSRKFYNDNFINDLKKNLSSNIPISKLLEPYIIDADELEMLEQLVINDGNIKFVELFRDRNKVVATVNSLGFHVMLPSIRDTLINNRQNYRNTRLESIFNTFANQLKTFLFKKTP